MSEGGGVVENFNLMMLVIAMTLFSLGWILFFSILPRHWRKYAKFFKIEPLPIWQSAIDGAITGLFGYLLYLFLPFP